MESLRLWLELAVPLGLLLLAYFTGGVLERRHYRGIRRREEATRSLPTMNFREPPEGWRVTESALVLGSVVVSIDYFKRFLARLRALVGGRIISYETLLDRGRREAILRMKEEALELGFDAVVNVRIETSRLANARGDGKGIIGVEILVFGTALKSC